LGSFNQAVGIGVIFVIETVYGNDSQESLKSGNLSASFKMPKNIRQIGKSNTQKKVYIEDYVMTFVKQLAGAEYSGCKTAVLVGQSIKLDNCRNIFISGAVEVNSGNNEGDIIFDNDIWNAIYEDIKKYFTDVEIVGWVVGGPGYLLEDEDKLLKIHMDNFAGPDKILLLYDSVEKEEAFYCFDSGRLIKQEGYYIYYEKNEEMQNYMIEHKQERSAEAAYDDKVSREIRTVLQNKKPMEDEGKSSTRLMYAAGTLLAVIILVVGAVILNNYDQMKSMKDTMESLSRNMDEIMGVFNSSGLKGQLAGNQTDDRGVPSSDAESDKNPQTDDSLNIEVLPGNVSPKPTQKTEQNTNEKAEGSTNQNSEANNSNNDNADGDQGKATETSNDNAPKVEEVKIYIVQSGDTLADISYKLYNTYTKVKEIMELNNIKNQDLIYAGQKLIVP